MPDSEDSDSDFVLYGTPLDQLDEAALPHKKAFTLEDQVSRDSSGRRRFHGAFTGGFSAGFMNTVGSLEGWKPAEFKSTRAERGTALAQRPQDFMDAEDIGEFGIAPNRLSARSDFSGAGASRKRPPTESSSGPIPGTPVLKQLLQPVRESMGVGLLKAMGWRLGQGVGPRVSRKEKKRTFGCARPPDEQQQQISDESDSDMEFESLTFAPDDIKPYVIAPKKNTFGLGYSGLERHSVLGSTSVSNPLQYTDVKNRKLNIRGQAFGVGAFEEEDEDIYSKEDMSQYDFSLGEDKAPSKPAISGGPGAILGFVHAKAEIKKKSFPPPPVPKGFIPRHTTKKSRFDTRSCTASLGRHDLNSETRGAMLQQTPHREETLLAPTRTVVGDVSGHTSHNFHPFQLDPDKQRRYEKYLKLSNKEELSDLQPPHMGEWERAREKHEFQQAENIFRPLTGVMGDRFTQAAQPDDLNSPLAIVEKTKHGNEALRNAALMKMFGALTRCEIEWQPCSLVCKRFNVPDPGKGSVVAAPSKCGSKYSIFDSLDALLVKQEAPSRAPSPPPVEDTAATQPSQDPLFADPVSKVDLFKAIFLDSSGEDEDDESTQPIDQVPYEEPVQNVERNSSPQRGLFANLDLDALASKPDVIQPPQPISLLVNSSGTRQVHLVETYGPKLPEKLISSCPKYESCGSSTEDEWIEKHKKSQTPKKAKKQKKHKSKHKKKKKKR